MTKKRWLVVIGALVTTAAIAPAYVRAYRVLGVSDAPSFLVGDRIVVNKAAYDVRLPYVDVVVFAHSAPEHGDVALFRPPGKDYLVFKRVVGCPGDRVEILDHRLRINGRLLSYERVDPAPFQSIATANELGSVLEEEAGNGPVHLVSFTPEAGPYGSFGPIAVPAGHYFMLGDNRGNSEDSRAYGSVPREAIQGKVYRISR